MTNVTFRAPHTSQTQKQHRSVNFINSYDFIPFFLSFSLPLSHTHTRSDYLIYCFFCCLLFSIHCRILFFFVFIFRLIVSFFLFINLLSSLMFSYLLISIYISNNLSLFPPFRVFFFFFFFSLLSPIFESFINHYHRCQFHVCLAYNFTWVPFVFIEISIIFSFSF